MFDSEIRRAVEAALHEDLGHLPKEKGDITASLIPSDQEGVAQVITRENCVICGTEWVDEVYKQLGDNVDIHWHVKDGDSVKADSLLCELKGNIRDLLTGERAALNFLQTLSGTATLVNTYVKVLQPFKTELLDTRKTLPGMRVAQKYAVKCGGGTNHRMGLFDAFLIKENHIMGCGSLTNAVMTAKSNFPGKTVEVEVESIEELEEALAAGADIIMLDNFTIPEIELAARKANGKAKLEVSGNMDISTIAEYAQTGVDFISVGALTKHVQAIDLSMRLQK